MEIIQKDREFATVLALVGDLDLTSSRKIRTCVDDLIAADRTRLIVDLREATGADSSGLGTLVASLTRLRKAGGNMILCGMNAEVETVMEITNVLDIFPRCAGEEEAIAALAELPGPVS